MWYVVVWDYRRVRLFRLSNAVALTELYVFIFMNITWDVHFFVLGACFIDFIEYFTIDMR